MSALADRQFAKAEEIEREYASLPIEVLLEKEGQHCPTCNAEVALVHTRAGVPFFIDKELTTKLHPRFTVEPSLCELIATRIDSFERRRGVAGYPRHASFCKGAK